MMASMYSSPWAAEAGEGQQVLGQGGLQGEAKALLAERIPNMHETASDSQHHRKSAWCTHVTPELKNWFWKRSSRISSVAEQGQSQPGIPVTNNNKTRQTEPQKHESENVGNNIGSKTFC